MGLFSSVIHLKDVSQDRAVEGLDQSMVSFGLQKKEDLRNQSNLCSYLRKRDWDDRTGGYLVSEKQGNWVTVIQAHFHATNIPWLPHLANRLSGTLSTFALALMLHDDDVFYYNLDHRGVSIDGYNSLPQYFEQQPLSKEAIDEQRHDVKNLTPVLPPGVSPEQIEVLLNKGWWKAYDENRLDENGVEQEDRGYVDDEKRMIHFGETLELNGQGNPYPYTAWAESNTINWSTFRGLVYRKQ